nr:hypothetical protein [uncultured Anaeromusa sp.]
MNSVDLTNLRNLIQTRIEAANVAFRVDDSQGFQQELNRLEMIRITAAYCGVSVVISLAFPLRLIYLKDQRSEVGVAL